MFIAYDKKKTIWGSGGTISKAIKDSKKWMKEDGEKGIALKTVQCSGEIYKKIEEGEFIDPKSWKIEDGVAVISWLDSSHSLSERVEETVSALGKMNGKHQGILTTILQNQLAIMRTLQEYP